MAAWVFLEAWGISGYPGYPGYPEFPEFLEFPEFPDYLEGLEIISGDSFGRTATYYYR
jgi:hypothetical protein